MKNLSIIIIYTFMITVCVSNIQADVLKENNNLNKYKYELFIINQADSTDKFLYIGEEFGGRNDNINREIKDVRLIISPGMYIKITDFYFNAAMFKLNAILYNKEKDFYLDMNKGPYYYLIKCDENMLPQISPIDNRTGGNIIKRLNEIKR